MYDDRDHRSDDAWDSSMHRSPTSRDHQYRSRHDHPRSPRRTPPRASRGDDSYRGQRHHSPSRRDHSYINRDPRYSRADSPDPHGHAPYHPRDSSGRSRNRYYRDHDDPRSQRHGGSRRPDSRASSPYDSLDDDYYREPNYRSRPGRPCHTLKLDIPEWMDSVELDSLIRDRGAAGLVEVRVKSDDRNGSRRSYAFAEFKSEDDATDFLEKYYPSIDVQGTHGSSARIYIEYSRDRRGQVASHDDWQCTMCHFENFSRRTTCKQCKAPRSSEGVMDMKLDGRSDECPQQAPSPFVVIRDLASSVIETVLATGMKKLYVAKDDEPKQAAGQPAKLKSTAPVGNTSGLGAKSGSLVRVFVIRDKYSDISCNYGFAEFSTLEDARAAMAKYHASPQFTISSKPVTVAFIHSGVFIPSLQPVQGQDRKFTFAATHNPSLRLGYWNPSVYPSEHLIYNENLYEDKVRDQTSLRKDADPSSTKDSKKRKAEKELAAPGGKKVIAMVPQLQKWANKHAEIHAPKDLPPNSSNDGDDDRPPATGVNAIGPPDTMPSSTPSVPSVSYADLDLMCCLLCRRKFKNEPSLRRHEQLSDMHKENLKNEALIAKATKDLMASGKEPVSNYRDRAKERRMAHQQPRKPKAHLPRKTNPGVIKEGEQPSDAAPAKSTVSKGAGLLAKMGWNTGQGLGAEGGGRTNIIETMAYTPGVGLGAEGGKIGDAAEEAARATRNDYADFVSKAKDKARERAHLPGYREVPVPASTQFLVASLLY
ncbi:hypothetical protein F4778DRAFT_797008 [Xylariomycetidae sp. FL2044]|nr:hypothetical protein F4778DRAFT_797008 [Xylariomycetidae sp. FL2044]